MQTNIENFYRSVAQNPALLDKIKTGVNTPDEFIDRAVAVAKDEGYAIDRTEAKTWIDSQIAARQQGELSDTQLEAVAGGKAGSQRYTPGSNNINNDPFIKAIAPTMRSIDSTISSWMSSW